VHVDVAYITDLERKCLSLWFHRCTWWKWKLRIANERSSCWFPRKKIFKFETLVPRDGGHVIIELLLLVTANNTDRNTKTRSNVNLIITLSKTWTGK